MGLSVVLVEPEIPENTGNIVRTCAATGTSLHLVAPLGFEWSSRRLKRAGLDYWQYSTIVIHESLEQFLQDIDPDRLRLYSTKGQRIYTENEYEDGDFLVFGSETRGLPSDLLDRFSVSTFRIPMLEGIRCLNLANSVSLVLYEALRQTGFEGLV